MHGGILQKYVYSSPTLRFRMIDSLKLCAHDMQITDKACYPDKNVNPTKMVSLECIIQYINQEWLAQLKQETFRIKCA